jgi:uncharacterized UPF0146 family protein
MEQAEQADSWLNWCSEHDVFVAYTPELLQAVADVLTDCPLPIVEVGAGCGELARELTKRGILVLATDPRATNNLHVVPLSATDALAMYQPATVFSSFLPVDAAIEAQIMRCSSVSRYLYIGPKIMGRVGPDSLWSVGGWRASAVPAIDNFLISRLDVLPDFTRLSHQRGAGAVLFERAQ